MNLSYSRSVCVCVLPKGWLLLPVFSLCFSLISIFRIERNIAKAAS